MGKKQKNRLTSSLLKGLAAPAICFISIPLLAQHEDSAVVQLEKVIVSDSKNPNTFTSRIPVQTLNQNTLQLLNAASIGDAARYFSGALIKDYGGVGGLKTISVRSLGASSTGIVYDGIPVSDAQTGQIDLSRFSSTFIQNLSLTQGSPTELLNPARSFASTSILAISSNTFQPVNFSKTTWKGELTAGSFGLWQPSAGIYLPVSKSTVISANSEAIFSKGNYPYTIQNGPYTENTKRTNSEVKSFQNEINLASMFKDSSVFQIKLRSYYSDRGLPGSIIFFNARSVQHLWNRDIYVQSRYRKTFQQNTSLLILAKYSNAYTRYTDPDFLNGMGGLDSRYKQQEYYLSGAISRKITQRLDAALASDISYSTLTANQQNFVTPARTGIWSNLSLKYSAPKWQLGAGLLNTWFSDKTKSGEAADHIDRLTPEASLSYKPQTNSPVLLRFFYKEAFRMPTFNDLYYNFIGNRNLKPEHTSQYNLGLTYTKNKEGKIRRLSFSADGYYNRIKDKIIAVPNQNLFNWTMFNLGEVRITGVDINAESNLVFNPSSNLFVRIAYTFQHAIDVTNPSSSNYKDRIPYTPDHSGSAFLSYSFQKWSAGYSILFSGNRYAQGTNDPDNMLSSWLTHDITLMREIRFAGFRSNIKAEVNNITDRKFDVVRYFPMPGRNFKISISFQNL